MSLSRPTDSLIAIAARFGVPSLRETVSRPGINEALRITIQSSDGKYPDSVATLIRGHGESCQLTRIYDKSGQAAALNFTIPLERFHKLLAVFRTNKFDTMDDQTDIPWTGGDLWLIERASGSFHHDVVLSSGNADGHHREIMLAIKQHLSEAVRELSS